MELIITIMFICNILFFLIFFRDKYDLFSPKNVLPFIYLIEFIPSMLYISLIGVPQYINKSIVFNAVLDDNVFIKFGILQMTAFVCMMIIVNIVIGPGISRRDNNNISANETNLSLNSYKYKRIRIWALIFLLISIAAFITNINSIGGLLFFLNNLNSRTILLRDQDLLVWLSSFMIYPPLLYIYSKKFANNHSKISNFIWVFIILLGLASGMGGRKNLLLLIISIYLVYNYSIRRIDVVKLINLKNLILAAIVIFIFAFLPLLRSEFSLDSFLNDPISGIQYTLANIGNLIILESYVPYFMTVIYYFQDSAIWLGTSFMGLLYAFIPSSLYPLKPPVDDGMYLYSISLGRTDIFPLMPVVNLNYSSYPLETFGSMYANFGSVGVIVGYIVLGLVIAKSYKYMQNRNYNLFSMLFYFNILMNFEISTLRITQTIISLILISVVAFTSENNITYKVKKR